MRVYLKPFILFVAATLLLVLPASYVLTEGLHKSERRAVRAHPRQVSAGRLFPGFQKRLPIRICRG